MVRALGLAWRLLAEKLARYAPVREQVVPVTQRYCA